MDTFREYFRSVEDVWAVWFAGAALLAFLILRAGRRRRWRDFARFLADERGASYALPYVLTFPVYVLVICVMIQATMIIMVKMQSMYAAYAAARAAVVWRSAEPEAEDETKAIERATHKARRAAALAMTPVASGFTDHLVAVSLYRAPTLLGDLADLQQRATDAGEIAPSYWAAYQWMHYLNTQSDDKKPPPRVIQAKYVDEAAGDLYLAKKVAYALMATDVAVEGWEQDKNRFNADLTVTVTYEMPMHIPGAGRLLGSFWGASHFYSRPVTSTAVLPSETPATDNQRLGIPYAAAQAN